MTGVIIPNKRETRMKYFQDQLTQTFQAGGKGAVDEGFRERERTGTMKIKRQKSGI